MLGLERLFRSRFGSTPQIDLDLQVARARVQQPQRFDFAALADGLKRSNLGVHSINFEAEVRFDGDRVVIVGSDQSFTLEGPATADGWVRLSVQHWLHPERTTLTVMPAPTVSPAEPATP